MGSLWTKCECRRNIDFRTTLNRLTRYGRVSGANSTFAAAMIELETHRLHLRPYKRDDIDHLAALYADPDVTAYTKLGLLTRAEAEAILEGYVANWRSKDFGIFSLLLKSSGEFAGECGLFASESSGDIALRYALHKRFWGQGLAAEAAHAVIGYAFCRLRLKRIVSFVEGPNAASHHVTQKLGLRIERIAQTSKGELHVYAVTTEQWAGGRRLSSMRYG